jgi:hypothetical protein
MTPVAHLQTVLLQRCQRGATRQHTDAAARMHETGTQPAANGASADDADFVEGVG